MNSWAAFAPQGEKPVSDTNLGAQAFAESRGFPRSWLLAAVVSDTGLGQW